MTKSKYSIVWVADDSNRRGYRDRQLYANKNSVGLYIEGHYNGSAYDKPGTQDNPASCLVASNSGPKTRSIAKAFADRVSDTFGYPNGGCVVTEDGDAGFYNLYYAKGNSVLLEPLYVSDAEQARMAQSREGVEIIAELIRDLVHDFYPDGVVIGMSIGHLFKPKAIHDRGAPVVNTDNLGEADLAKLYMIRAAQLILGDDFVPPDVDYDVEFLESIPPRGTHYSEQLADDIEVMMRSRWVMRLRGLKLRSGSKKAVATPWSLRTSI